MPRTAPGRRHDRAIVDELDPIDDRQRGRRRGSNLDGPTAQIPSVMTSPGSRPSTTNSINGPDETNVRPARTASAHATKRQFPAQLESGIGPDRAKWDLGRHLVRATDDRQPETAVEEAVPLTDRRAVDARRECLHLDRVDLAGDDVGRDLGIGQREVDGQRQPVLGADGVRPVRHEHARADRRVRPSGEPPLAIGTTAWAAPSRPMWPSMFWRFSLPITTRWRPDGSCSATTGRSVTLVWWSPHWVASRLTISTPSARAWRSADDGEMKWTWQSAATQPSPNGPGDRRRGRARAEPHLRRPRSFAEAAGGRTRGRPRHGPCRAAGRSAKRPDT